MKKPKRKDPSKLGSRTKLKRRLTRGIVLVDGVRVEPLPKR
jgi:hypothetical protein